MFERHEYDAKKTLDSCLSVALNDHVMIVAAERESAVPGVRTRRDCVHVQPGGRVTTLARRVDRDNGRSMGWGGGQ